jgi:glycine/D-amino acid oxidase-like deaminating enzyme
MKRTKYDVAVIGAGVFGSWCAHFLNRAGLSVVLVDAYGPGNSRASSGGETRIIRLGYGRDVIYSKWSARSHGFWRALSEESQQSLFLPTGMLWMAREGDPQTLSTEITLNELGFPFERLERDDLESRFPQINFGPITWGLFEPMGGVILARRAVQAVVAGLVARGAEYHQEAILPPNGSGSVDYISTREWQSHRGRQIRFCLWAMDAAAFPGNTE